MAQNAIAFNSNEKSILYSHDNQYDFIMFIENGSVWEVELASNTEPESAISHVEYTLQDYEIINEVRYHKLFMSVDGDTPTLISYLNINRFDKTIYALDPNNIEAGESLIYNFSAALPETDRIVAYMDWDGSISQTKYHFTMKTESYLSFSDYQYGKFNISLYPNSMHNAEEQICETTWYEGVGTLHGLTNQIPALNPDITTTLIRLTSPCNGVVYEQNLTGSVETLVEPASSGDGIKYRIDGTRMQEGEKGIYIMNGKKYINR